MNAVRVKILKEGARLPAYGSAQAAGADLYACLTEAVTVAPGETAFIPTGIALEVPLGCAGLIYARSGMACKRGLAPANKVGVVDSDYRGEIIVALHNHGTAAQTVENCFYIFRLVTLWHYSEVVACHKTKVVFYLCHCQAILWIFIHIMSHDNVLFLTLFFLFHHATILFKRNKAIALFFEGNQ